MPWQKKASAPAYVSLYGFFASGIAGTDISWLTPMLPMLPDIQVDVGALCSAGPPSAPQQIDPGDVASTIPSGGRFSWASTALGSMNLADKLSSIFNDRVFSVYCELPPETAGEVYQTIWEGDIQGTTAANSEFPVAGGSSMPTGSVHLRITISNNTFTQSLYLDASTNRTTWTPVLNTNGGFKNQTWIFNSNSAYAWWRGNRQGNPSVGAAHFKFEASYMAQTTYHTATPITQDPALPMPLSRTYSTIQDLGSVLDQLYTAIEHLNAKAEYIAGAQPLPPGDPETPQTVDEGDEIAVAGHVGAIVQVSGIPGGIGAHWGNPAQYIKLGWTTVWTKDGPLAPIPLVHSPQVIHFGSTPVTKVTVSVKPPMQASVRLLKQPK